MKVLKFFNLIYNLNYMFSCCSNRKNAKFGFGVETNYELTLPRYEFNGLAVYIPDRDETIDGEYCKVYKEHWMEKHKTCGFFSYDLFGNGKSTGYQLKKSQLMTSDFVNQLKDVMSLLSKELNEKFPKEADLGDMSKFAGEQLEFLQKGSTCTPCKLMCKLKPLSKGEDMKQTSKQKFPLYLIGRGLGGYLAMIGLRDNIFDHLFFIKGVVLISATVDTTNRIWDKDEDTKIKLKTEKKMEYIYDKKTNKSITLNYNDVLESYTNYNLTKSFSITSNNIADDYQLFMCCRSNDKLSMPGTAVSLLRELKKEKAQIYISPTTSNNPNDLDLKDTVNYCFDKIASEEEFSQNLENYKFYTHQSSTLANEQSTFRYIAPKVTGRPTVVYVHGSGGHIFDEHTYHFQDYWSQKGFGFFCYDLLGRGFSTSTMDKVLISELILQAKEILKEVLHKTILKSPKEKAEIILLTRSIGGYIAANLFKDKFFDGLFKIEGAVLMCPAIDRRNVFWNEDFTEDQKKELEVKGILDYEYIKGKTVKIKYNYVMDGLKNCDILNTVKTGDIKIDYKMFQIYGSKDTIAQPEIGRRFEKILDTPSNVEFVETPKGNHSINDDESVEIIDACFNKIAHQYNP